MGGRVVPNKFYPISNKTCNQFIYYRYCYVCTTRRLVKRAIISRLLFLVAKCRGVYAYRKKALSPFAFAPNCSNVNQKSLVAAQPRCKPGLLNCKHVRFVEAKRSFSLNGLLTYQLISSPDRSCSLRRPSDRTWPASAPTQT